MRRDVKTDWTVRDDVRAKLRSSIKRLLVKYKYPPDKQPEAIRLVIEQMERWRRGTPIEWPDWPSFATRPAFTALGAAAASRYPTCVRARKLDR